MRKFFERWGSGTTKIIDLCSNYGLPAPEFEEYSGGFALTLKFAAKTATVNKPQQEKLINQPAAQIIELSLRQKDILKIIKKYQSVTINQIMQYLADAPSKRMIQKDLLYLKQHDFIELIGTSRSSIWVIKNSNL
jgi:ATP-dependent DNA helicase RecG